MPNQYKNKVVYGDSVLMDITDTTAEAGDVASGAVFYAKNGARTVGTFIQAQSDWNETDSTDPSYILNKPTIDASLSETSSNAVRNSEITAALNDKQGSAIYGSANTGDSDFITPSLVALYTTDAYHRDVILTYTDSYYGLLHFSSWSVADSAGIIVSNVILYYNELLCATLVGDTTSQSATWIFHVYPIQGTLTFDSTPTNNSTNPVTSGGVYTALSSKANSADIPSASSATPLVDGTAAVGTSTAYARADHVHPKITQTISMSNNVITLTGSDGSTSSVTLPVYSGGVTGITGATGGTS